MAISAYSLCSLAQLKDYRKQTTTAEDSYYEDLCTRATEQIEEYCSRKFVARNYFSWLKPRGCFLFIPNTPIIKLSGIYQSSQGTFSVGYSSSTDVEATLSVGEISITLSTIDSVGTETSSVLLFSTYKTVSALVAAIALVSGWSASTQSNMKAQFLIPSSYDCLGSTCSVLGMGKTKVEVETNFRTGVVAPIQPRQTLVQYRGGYETSEIPAALTAAAIQWAAALDKQFSDTVQKDGYTMGFTKLKNSLAPWRRMVVA